MENQTTIFSVENFQTLIRYYCEDHGWACEEESEDIVSLKVEGDEGGEIPLLIQRCDATIHFSAASSLYFPSIDEIPHLASTGLLQMNSDFEIGYWSIFEISGQFNYSFNHNQEASVLDSDLFGGIVRHLVDICGKINAAAEDSME